MATDTELKLKDTFMRVKGNLPTGTGKTLKSILFYSCKLMVVNCKDFRHTLNSETTRSPTLRTWTWHHACGPCLASQAPPATRHMHTRPPFNDPDIQRVFVPILATLQVTAPSMHSELPVKAPLRTVAGSVSRSWKANSSSCSEGAWET